MKIYVDLFCTWFKIGLFTFGGGYAMLPLIEKEIIEKHHWATQDEVLDYYAIGQCTPGIIAVNTATFIGYYQKGILGGIVSTLGVVAPSIVIITIIATLLPTFQDLPVVKHALSGISIGVCILMVTSILKLWKGSVKDKVGIFIFCLSLTIAFIFRTATVWVIILAGVCGLIFSNIKKLEEVDE